MFEWLNKLRLNNSIIQLYCLNWLNKRSIISETLIVYLWFCCVEIIYHFSKFFEVQQIGSRVTRGLASSRFQLLADMLVHIVEFALGPHALPYCVSLKLAGQLLLLIGVLLYWWALILHGLELLEILTVSYKFSLRHEGGVFAIAFGYRHVRTPRDHVGCSSWWHDYRII